MKDFLTVSGVLCKDSLLMLNRFACVRNIFSFDVPFACFCLFFFPIHSVFFPPSFLFFFCVEFTDVSALQGNYWKKDDKYANGNALLFLSYDCLKFLLLNAMYNCAFVFFFFKSKFCLLKIEENCMVIVRAR